MLASGWERVDGGQFRFVRKKPFRMPRPEKRIQPPPPNLDVAHWRDEQIPTPPGEPPEITAKWHAASAAMERADRASGHDFQDRRTRREALEEVYSLLRSLRSEGATETRKAWSLTHAHRPNGRPLAFGRQFSLTVGGISRYSGHKGM